jgi:hypothetical protein
MIHDGRVEEHDPRRDGSHRAPNPTQSAMIHDARAEGHDLGRDGIRSSSNPAQSSMIRDGGAEDEDLRQEVVQRSFNPAHSSMIHGGPPGNHASHADVAQSSANATPSMLLVQIWAENDVQFDDGHVQHPVQHATVMDGVLMPFLPHDVISIEEVDAHGLLSIDFETASLHIRQRDVVEQGNHCHLFTYIRVTVNDAIML